RAAEVDKLLPDDAEGVLSFNVRQILDAPLVQKHGVGLWKKHLASKPEVQKVLESLGFDPLKDVTTMTVAGPSAGADSDKALLIVHGRFDLAKFQATAQEAAKDMGEYLKIHKVGDTTLWEVREKSLGENKSVFVGLVDSTTLVASGSREYVVDAFDRAAGKKASNLNKELKELIAKADAGQSLWMVALGGPLARSALANDEQL